MIKDLQNKRFGKLVVLKYNGNARWLCQCDCGNQTIVRSDYLKTGHTKSCGCIHSKYGGNVKNDRLYRLYRGIINRTERLRKNNHNHTYIEKEIKMCDEWRKDFNKFKEWALLNGYDYSKTSNEQTIDRIDNDKGYYPENCRFVSRADNNRNESKKRGIFCLNKVQQNQVVELYKRGYSSRKIGEKFKVNKTTIMRIVKALTKEELK